MKNMALVVVAVVAAAAVTQSTPIQRIRNTIVGHFQSIRVDIAFTYGTKTQSVGMVWRRDSNPQPTSMILK